MDKSDKGQKRRASSGSITNLEFQSNTGHDILTVSIKELSVLYSSYMPFLIGGGIFIPTIDSYDIGDEVFLLINLFGEKERVPVVGKVVWITPAQTQTNRVSGIGLEFLDKNSEAKNKIKSCLGGMLESTKQTCTL